MPKGIRALNKSTHASMDATSVIVHLSFIPCKIQKQCAVTWMISILLHQVLSAMSCWLYSCHIWHMSPNRKISCYSVPSINTCRARWQHLFLDYRPLAGMTTGDSRTPSITCRWEKKKKVKDNTRSVTCWVQQPVAAWKVTVRNYQQCACVSQHERFDPQCRKSK